MSHLEAAAAKDIDAGPKSAARLLPISPTPCLRWATVRFLDSDTPDQRYPSFAGGEPGNLAA